MTPKVWLVAASIALAGVAESKPFPRFADAPRLSLTISPYAEDMSRWTPPRVSEALSVADAWMDRCGIDLITHPLEPLYPGDEQTPEALWRTRRSDELVAVLRAPGDRRTYAMAGVATLRRVGDRWMGEAPWTPTVLAVAQVLGAGRLKTWPRPTGPGSSVAMSKARLAVLWAAAKGWITMQPMVAEDHCVFLRAQVKRLNARRHRRPPDRRFVSRAGWHLTLPGPPAELLVADVVNRDALTVAARVGETWWQLLVRPDRRGQAARPQQIPAAGRGLGLFRLGGASLLLSAPAEGGVHARWWHDSPARRADYRPARRLPGCARLLAADVVTNPRTAKGSGQDDPGVVLVACPDRTFQLTPLPIHEERIDPHPPATWATISRWGPSRARVVLGGSPTRALDVVVHQAPILLPPDPRVEALAGGRPAAPIWWPIGAAPIQLGPEALHGLSGGPLPLGADASATLLPQRHRVLRRVQTPGGLDLRIDTLHREERRFAGLAPGSLVATHGGDRGPSVWVLAPAGRQWSLSAPAHPDRAAGQAPRRRRACEAAPACARQGLCGLGPAGCRATAARHCWSSAGCREAGRCALIQGRCGDRAEWEASAPPAKGASPRRRAQRDAERACLKSAACRDAGACWPSSKGSCRVSPESCALSRGCREAGRCTPDRRRRACVAEPAPTAGLRWAGDR